MKLMDWIIPATLIVLLALSALTGSALAQNRTVVAASSITPPVPIYAVPGGIITIYVAGLSPTAIPANAGQFPLPTVLGGISASIEQFARTVPVVPLISVFAVSTCPTDPNDVSPSCGALTGIRLQIPFGVVANVPGSNTAPTLTRLFLTDQAGNSAAVDLAPVLDRIHILTFEETHSGLSIPNNRLAQPLVTHADGSLVTAAKPAKSGEQLVAYAVGLGYADPFPVTGAPSPSPAPRARTQFLINYAFSPNAAPSRGLIPIFPSSVVTQFPAPTFAGLSPGSVGLYQLNFIVPAVPAGTHPCGDVVYSNLTVSFVGSFSLDGAPICVAVP
jgi:hypothetical protein